MAAEQNNHLTSFNVKEQLSQNELALLALSQALFQLSPLNQLESQEESCKQWREYLERLFKIGELSMATLIHGKLLFKTYLGTKKAKKLIKSSVSPRVIYSICCYIAHKFNQDCEIWFLEEYSLISGIPLEWVRKLEVKVLLALDYKIYSSYQKIENCWKKLLTSASKQCSPKFESTVPHEQSEQAQLATNPLCLEPKDHLNAAKSEQNFPIIH